MARSHAVLKSSVWEKESDFRLLTPLAQLAYVMLLSQPQVSNLGILAYTPEKWARLSAGLDLETVEASIDELAGNDYVILDRPVGELLVRTFIKHDKVWSQWQLVANARRLIRETESDTIRRYLVDRHGWLLEAEWFADAPAFEPTKDGVKARRKWDQEKIENYEGKTPLDRAVDTPLLEAAAAARKTPLHTPVERTDISKRVSTGEGKDLGVNELPRFQEDSKAEASGASSTPIDPNTAAAAELINLLDQLGAGKPLRLAAFQAGQRATNCARAALARGGDNPAGLFRRMLEHGDNPPPPPTAAPPPAPPCPLCEVAGGRHLTDCPRGAPIDPEAL